MTASSIRQRLHAEHAALVLVLLLAVAPRLVWFRAHQPELPPDSYGYLNVAREWRGEQLPAGRWDDRTQLPWDNQGARTPTYPLFLDLVFLAARRSPTPDAALAAPRAILASSDATSARAHHLAHLETDENVKAVQAAQHGIGVAATAMAFLTLLQWTGSTIAAALGALIAVGWNPVWIVIYEPSVMTEVPSGFLLLVAVWLASQPSSGEARAHAAAAACGVAMTIRPPMFVSAAPILAYLVWRRRRDGLRALSVLALPLLLVVLVIANNGLRYRYWALASAGGGTLMSHAAQHPEGLRPPLDEFADRIRGNRDGGQLLLYALSVERGRPYLEASRTIQRASVDFVLDHPRWYIASVARAFIDFCSPPYRLVPGAWNRVQQRWPLAWLVVSGASTLVLLAGVLALALPVPTGVKLGPMVFLVTAAGLSMAANTENKRFAAPVVPLALMSGVAVLTEAPRRIWRGSIVVAVDAIKGEQPRERASGTPVPASRRS